MSDKPSLCSSTLSLMAVWSVVAFTVAAGGVGWGLAHGLEKEVAAIVMAPFATLLSGFGMSYLTARKTGNSEPAIPVVPVVPAIPVNPSVGG